jgi:hypothetical protein
VVDKGDTLCHYGAGSANSSTKPEHCGELVSPVANGNGYYSIITPDYGGDSGGPVYVYKRENGKAVGVYAVGMALVRAQYCLGHCVTTTQFIPISDVLADLGLKNVITAPSL